MDEFDPEASLLGAKRLGEPTAVSVAPAIVNAVYHATGKRIRDLPVTVEKLLWEIPCLLADVPGKSATAAAQHWFGIAPTHGNR
jgi:hypothetical protein